jgi:predicted dehydrogenase
MSKLRIAVVGAGHLGRIHARLLSGMQDVELAGIADPVARAREEVAAECRAEAFADHRALLGRVDAVVIATPTSSHHAVATDFLRHNVHLLVEKPLTCNREQADELVSMAHRRSVVLQVGHIERFNPALAAAAPHVRDPKYIEAIRAGAFTFRSTDVGVVLDLMIHDLDVALSLTRSPVKNVQALGVAVVGRHEDVAQARLEFENGCVANLSASRVSHVPRRQMQIWTQQAFVSLDFAGVAANLVRPSDVLLRRQIDLESISCEERDHLKANLMAEHLPIEQLTIESRNALADELRDFVDSIVTLRSPRVTGQQGRDVLAVAEQILGEIEIHAWQGRHDGPRGPRAMPQLPILRGPHWEHATRITAQRREAG